MEAGFTPLHVAAKAKKWEIVAYLIKAGAECKYKTPYNETLLSLIKDKHARAYLAPLSMSYAFLIFSN